MGRQNKIRTEAQRCFEGMLFMTVAGIIIIIGSISVFFVWGRPFTKFVYYECIIRNKDFFPIDADNVRVLYYVDGKLYDKVLAINEGKGGWTSVPFYYNEDDPNDVVSIVRNALLVIMPISAVFGLFIVLIGILHYSQFRKKQTAEQIKQEVKNNGVRY